MSHKFFTITTTTTSDLPISFNIFVLSLSPFLLKRAIKFITLRIQTSLKVRNEKNSLFKFGEDEEKRVFKLIIYLTASWNSQMVDNSELTTISDLKPQAIYTIRVQAFTSMGAGEFHFLFHKSVYLIHQLFSLNIQTLSLFSFHNNTRQL